VIQVAVVYDVQISKLRRYMYDLIYSLLPGGFVQRAIYLLGAENAGLPPDVRLKQPHHRSQLIQIVQLSPLHNQSTRLRANVLTFG
jgi:hypothetical protein